MMFIFGNMLVTLFLVGCAYGVCSLVGLLFGKPSDSGHLVVNFPAGLILICILFSPLLIYLVGSSFSSSNEFSLFDFNYDAELVDSFLINAVVVVSIWMLILTRKISRHRAES